MSALPTWHPLPVSSSHGIPALLVSTSYSKDSYDIHVTDLANIWHEALDRKAIWRRSLLENTSIDPTEDPQNMVALMSKIRAALDTSAEDHDQTSLALSPLDENGLLLTVTCTLGGGLKPLKWPIHMYKCPPSAMTTHLVLPLIQAQQARAHEIGALRVIVKNKDNVITKLADKLEAVGTPLEHVFTSLAGKKKVTRAQAEDRVKGLAPYNASDVENAPSAIEDGSNSVGGLIEAVFGGAGLTYQSSMDSDGSATLDGWWAKIGPGQIVLSTDRKKKASNSKSPAPTIPATRDTKADDDDDDDFQVQSTPPHLMSKKKHDTPKRPIAADDESTEDDENAVTIPDSNPPPASQPSYTPVGRLGAIGKSKKPARQITASPEPAAEPVANDSDATASEPDDEPAPAKSPSPEPPPAKPKRGLGRIGGKAGEKTPVAAEKSVSPQPEGSPKDGAKKKGRIGHIGKKSAGATSEQGPHAAQDKTKEAAPRQTSEERADHKRAELQRELERKAAAGPARKKRKF